MTPARLAILAVAVGAAGLAGYLAMTLATPEPVIEAAPAPVIERQETRDVLIVTQSMPIGSRLDDSFIAWQAWPEDAVTASLITRDERPNAIADLDGSIVRVPMLQGEPMRTEKIVDDNANIMSALLPAGKRAVSLNISVSTSAGGFILPNDRVDIIMVRRNETTGYKTDVVLRNIRVLAIDQTLQQEEDGGETAIGSTATLELTPEQAQALAVAQQVADRLTLALRSVADVREPDTEICADLLTGNAANSTIQLIRDGTITTVGKQNNRGNETCWFESQDLPTASIGE